MHVHSANVAYKLLALVTTTIAAVVRVAANFNNLGWEQFSHLVNAERLEPNFSRSSHCRIENSFSRATTSQTTANELDI